MIDAINAKLLSDQTIAEMPKLILSDILAKIEEKAKTGVYDMTLWKGINGLPGQVIDQLESLGFKVYAGWNGNYTISWGNA